VAQLFGGTNTITHMKQVFPFYPFIVLFFAVVNMQVAVAQSTEKPKANTSEIQVSKLGDDDRITINFTVTSPAENVLILIRNEKGDLVFMENRNRFQGAYTRTINLKEVEGKKFDVQIKNDAEQINRTISMR
jgi:hypothetical protein